MADENLKTSEKKKLEPVVDHDVTVTKKSKGKQAMESFLGEEVETVKDHILYDLVIPSSKDALSNMCGSVVDFFNDMFHEFIDSIFFGSSKTPKVKASETYVSYQGYYNKKSSNNHRRREPLNSKRHNIEDLSYETMEDALKVRNEMKDRVDHYRQVTVAELFDLSGKTLDWAEYQEKDKWGWTDLSYLDRPRRRRGKYVLPLTKPERLED